MTIAVIFIGLKNVLLSIGLSKLSQGWGGISSGFDLLFRWEGCSELDIERMFPKMEFRDITPCDGEAKEIMILLVLSVVSN